MYAGSNFHRYAPCLFNYLISFSYFFVIFLAKAADYFHDATTRDIELVDAHLHLVKYHFKLWTGADFPALYVFPGVYVYDMYILYNNI